MSYSLLVIKGGQYFAKSYQIFGIMICVNHSIVWGPKRAPGFDKFNANYALLEPSKYFWSKVKTSATDILDQQEYQKKIPRDFNFIP